MNFTRGGIHWNFGENNEIVTITTPGGNCVVLNDKSQEVTITDQHNNSITMDRNGITLNASKITLKAQQDVVVEAGTNLNFEGGANASIKAGAQLKAEGSAGAELSTPAIATIKGSMVKIN